MDDIARPIKCCILLLCLWLTFSIGMDEFRLHIRLERPRYTVVDFETEMSVTDHATNLKDLAKERGWPDASHFTTADGAKDLEQEYSHTRWVAYGSFAVAIISALAIVITARRLWDDWWMGLAILIFGPLAIVWGARRIEVDS